MKSPTKPGSTPSDLPDWVGPATVAIIGLAVWLSLPDATMVFDGIQFSQVVDRTVDTWRADVWNPRHLVFIRAFQLLRDGLAALHMNVEAYRLFQIVNAALAAVAAAVCCDAARRLSGSRVLGVATGAFLAATLCWGTRATEGQVYMAMTLGAACVYWFAVVYVESPTAAGAWMLAGAGVLAALFHAADAFLFPAVTATILLARPRKRAAFGALAAAPALLYTAYRTAFPNVGFADFLSRATEVHASSAHFGRDLFSAFWNAGDSGPGGRLLRFLQETGGAVLSLPAAAAGTLGAAMLAATGGGLFYSWPRMDAVRRRQAVVLGTGWVGFSTVNVFWPGGAFFYGPPLIALVGLWALSARPHWASLLRQQKMRGIAVMVMLLGGLGIYNLRFGLLPQSRLENNRGYQTARYVGEHTVPSAVVVISGFGIPNAKVYLPRFSQRTREVLEYYLNTTAREEGLARFKAKMARFEDLGVPLYLLSDLVEDGTALQELKRLWAVTPSDVQACFGPGGIVRTAESPAVRVYLFLPAQKRPELFSTLSYSILTEPVGPAFNEAAVAAELLARQMSSPEKRRAGELMKSSDWGFESLRAAFAPAMAPESVARAEVRRRRFHEYQNGPEFWLKAGNLYRLLELKADALAAWEKAESLSGDAELRRRIDEYRRSR